jgi:hypothetical protein
MAVSVRDLLIFMAVLTSFVVGITATGWFYFHRWYVEEKTNGRRQIDLHKAEMLREQGKNITPK